MFSFSEWKRVLLNRAKFSKFRKTQKHWRWAALSLLLIGAFQNCSGGGLSTLTDADEELAASSSDGAGGRAPGSVLGGTAPTLPPEEFPTTDPDAARKLEEERLAYCVSLMGKPIISNLPVSEVLIKSGAGPKSGDQSGARFTLEANRSLRTTVNNPKNFACNHSMNLTCDFVSGNPSMPSFLSRAIDDGGSDQSARAQADEAERLKMIGVAVNIGNNACSVQVGDLVAGNDQLRSRNITLTNRRNGNPTSYRCVEGSAWVRIRARVEENNMNRSEFSDPAYVKIKLENSCWDEARLKNPAKDLDENSKYGSAVAIDGNWAVGLADQEASDPGQSGSLPQTGSLHIFKKENSQWVFRKRVVLNGAMARDTLTAVAIKGSRMAVSSINRGGQGAVVIFKLDAGDVWAEAQTILPPVNQTGQKFGYSLQLTDNRLIIGAPNRTQTVEGSLADGAGAVYIYACDVSSCSGTPSLALDGSNAYRALGASLATSGDYLAVGAPQALLHEGEGKGFVNVYQLSTGALLKTISPADGNLGMGFGSSLSLLGKKLAVGASNFDLPQGAGLSSVGRVYFYNDFSLATNQALTGQAEKTFFGKSVALGSTGLFVGCIKCVAAQGVAEFFPFSGAGVTATSSFTLFGLNATADDQFGSAIGVSGNDIIVGAMNRRDPNRASGAVYVYRKP